LQELTSHGSIGTKLEEFPLPSEFPTLLGAALDKLAQELAAASPSTIASSGVPTATALREGREKWEATRGRMIAVQEELDWQVYALYGLLDQEITASAEDIPVVASAERAFAIVLARKMKRGEVSTSWFGHHRDPRPLARPVSGNRPEAHRRH
jgi:hypothetical protein